MRHQLYLTLNSPERILQIILAAINLGLSVALLKAYQELMDNTEEKYVSITFVSGVYGLSFMYCTCLRKYGCVLGLPVIMVDIAAGVVSTSSYESRHVSLSVLFLAVKDVLATDLSKRREYQEASDDREFFIMQLFSKDDWNAPFD